MFGGISGICVKNIFSRLTVRFFFLSLALAAASGTARAEGKNGVEIIYGIRMVTLKPDTFSMGGGGNRTEKPIHTVRLDRFRISVTEITQAQFLAVMDTNPSEFQGDPGRPVESVRWYDAAEFCNALSELTGLEPCYDPETWEYDFTAGGFRLPTEAEWEYACRAGTTTLYHAGDSTGDLSACAWHKGQSGMTTHPVAGRMTNAWGLYDMHGNVYEWCNDFHDPAYYSSSPSKDPLGPVTGSMRVRRGGSWAVDSTFCRAAFRGYSNPLKKRNDVGFRVAISRILSAEEVARGIERAALEKEAEQAEEIPIERVDQERKVPDAPDTSTTRPKIEPPTPDSALKPAAEPVKAYPLRLVKVPVGSFSMGSRLGEDEQPVHTVRLDSFRISATEITQAQYQAVMDTNPSEFQGDPNRPVECVSWFDAVEFCNRLSESRGLELFYDPASWESDYSKNGFRLPTEAEWEYAARAGTTTMYHEGDRESALAAAGWYKGQGVGETRTVGLKNPSAWGLYDMHGNVYEWCNDLYSAVYYAESPEDNPAGPDSGSVMRIRRGGSWSVDTTYCRAAFRACSNPAKKRNDIGFRVVLSEGKAPVEKEVLEKKAAVSKDTETEEKAQAAEEAPQKEIIPEVQAERDSVIQPESPDIRMVRIPAGSFLMGSLFGEDEQPVHTVKLDSFRISATEITQAQYQAVMDTNPSEFQGDPNRPVECVSWFDAKEFCNRLSESRSLDPFYDPASWECDYSKNGFRLPTEAEWEYAARAGTKTRYHGGDRESALAASGWYKGQGVSGTRTVGLKEPSAWGLYDMHGNVYEWCNDLYSAVYYAESPGDNPAGPDSGSVMRIRRGGSWSVDTTYCRAAFRGFSNPAKKRNDIGFRVLLPGLAPPEKAEREEKVAVIVEPPGPGEVPAKEDSAVDADTTVVIHAEVILADKETRRKLMAPGIRMVRIPPVTFSMGCKDYKTERPVHTVRLDAYQISATEITQAQYQAVMDTNSSEFQGDPSQPVESVSWYDAVRFCNRLSGSMALEPCYDLETWECDYSKSGFRLPTEAEWEYAARAGTTTMYYCGNTAEELVDFGRYKSPGVSEPWAVGRKKPNALGLYDMHGNVYEWCNDYYGDSYYAQSPQKNPVGPEKGSMRIRRGGSWSVDTTYCRSAFRGYSNPAKKRSDIGFRVVLSWGWPGEYAVRKKREPAAREELKPVEKIPAEQVVEDSLEIPAVDISRPLVAEREVEPAPPAPAVAPPPPVKKKRPILQEKSGIRMVRIPAGLFPMGSRLKEDEQPVHTVELVAYQISAAEITQAQYLAVMGVNPAEFQGIDSHPVESVSWYEAAEFCNRLSRLLGLTPCYDLTSRECDYSHNGARLPTEAEWEYAARAGTATRYHEGDSERALSLSGWYKGQGLAGTQPVGSRKPNAWGLYDMHGNVYEWCNDFYDLSYYARSELNNPAGPDSGFARIRRGGSWSVDHTYCRAGFRGASDPGKKRNDIGFRVVISDGVARSEKEAVEEKAAVAEAASPEKERAPPEKAVEDTALTAPAPADTAPKLEILKPGPPAPDIETASRESVQPKAYPIRMIDIPSSIITMGNYINRDEQPLHRVELNPYRISVTEITQAQYTEVMGTYPSRFKGNHNRPVENVSWYEAAEFCNRLSESRGLEPCYDPKTWNCDFTKKGCRLPTEAEWENAARAGTRTKYHNGDSEFDLYLSGWYDEHKTETTVTVKERTANAWGLYDMHGNVYEWCNDYYAPDYYAVSPPFNPTGPETGSNRIRRGGSWAVGAVFCRSAFRGCSSPETKRHDIGFRIVFSEGLPPVTLPEKPDTAEQPAVAAAQETEKTPETASGDRPWQRDPYLWTLEDCKRVHEPGSPWAGIESANLPDMNHIRYTVDVRIISPVTLFATLRKNPLETTSPEDISNEAFNLLFEYVKKSFRMDEDILFFWIGVQMFDENEGQEKVMGRFNSFYTMIENHIYLSRNMEDRDILMPMDVSIKVMSDNAFVPVRGRKTNPVILVSFKNKSFITPDTEWFDLVIESDGRLRPGFRFRFEPPGMKALGFDKGF
ncbi:MAG: SUMF1/EgtB/PvdO family nonheme iron enzyme [Gemmatimonadota bacterium]|nr:SUMF1/EgtB/PvdO family nonheme iron enzyme [Gemmatimonadota bacterium]